MADTNTTWKQVVYDAADAYRTASATTANVKVGELAQKISTLEDVTAEVTTQTPLIEDIIEALETKGITPTNGIYIWQRTSENTTEYVVSDDPSTYPDDGEQGGFTYKKIQTTETTEITPGTTDQTISALSLLLNNLVIKGDSNLVASNIKSGVNIFGVIGTMVQGQTGIDYGTVVPANAESEITVNHSLGKTPRYVFLVKRDSFDAPGNSEMDSPATNRYSSLYADHETFTGYVYKVYNSTASRTTTSITFRTSLACFGQGTVYYWFAVA